MLPDVAFTSDNPSAASRMFLRCTAVRDSDSGRDTPCRTLTHASSTGACLPAPTHHLPGAILKKNFSLVALAALTLLGSAASAGASPIVYSAFDIGAGAASPRPNSDAMAATFAAALGSSTLVTFELSPLGVFNDLAIASGVTMDGTDHEGDNQEIRNSPRSTPDSRFGHNTTSGGTQFVSVFGGTITFTFASPITAFGAYFSGIENGSQVLRFNDGSPQSVAFPNITSGMAFVGFTNANPFSSLSVIASDIIGVDDVRFGAAAVGAAPVPEPATFALLGLGLVSAAVARHRRRR